MNKDIIISFFNPEEELLNVGGSKKLAEELESKYNTVVNINIDCIGLNDDVTVVGYNINTPINNSIVKELEELLVKYSIKTTSGEYMTSDHDNFQNGICLYTEKQRVVIHSVKDMPKNIDSEKIRQISSLLCGYITDLCKNKELSKISNENEISTSIITKVDKNEIMNIGECKVIEKNGKKKHLNGYNYFGKLEGAEELFE